jgi:hypothetical protein
MGSLLTSVRVDERSANLGTEPRHGERWRWQLVARTDQQRSAPGQAFGVRCHRLRIGFDRCPGPPHAAIEAKRPIAALNSRDLQGYGDRPLGLRTRIRALGPKPSPREATGRVFVLRPA